MHLSRPGASQGREDERPAGWGCVVMIGAMKILAGNSNGPHRRGDRRLSRRAADQMPCAPLRRSRDIRRNPRKRARPRHVHHPVDVLSDQRQSDGAADHDRRAAARVGAAHHRRHSLFRLCAAGPQARAALADLGQAGRQSDHPRGRRPRADRRSARRPDPGLFRHSDRQSVRRAGDGARHQGSVARSRT